MEDFKPVTSEYLRQLRAQTIEEARQIEVKRMVNHVYSQTLLAARTKHETVYYCEINAHDIKRWENNMPDILNVLKQLFVGCSVEYKTQQVPFNGNQNLLNVIKCIAIDWS